MFDLHSLRLQYEINTPIGHLAAASLEKQLFEAQPGLLGRLHTHGTPPKHMYTNYSVYRCENTI